MPWHRDPGLRDFSLLEVTRYVSRIRQYQLFYCVVRFILNRDLSHVRGFTRETLHAVIANIESREWRRCYCLRKGIPLEHPRASTTDDVECFFSVLRDNVGKHFTLREVTCCNFYTTSQLICTYMYTSSGFVWMEKGHNGIFETPGSRPAVLLLHIQRQQVPRGKYARFQHPCFTSKAAETPSSTRDSRRK